MGSDGDAAATVAHAAKEGDGEEEEDAGAAVELPHAAAPVGAPNVYCCGGERSMSCYGGAEESKGGDGEKEKGGVASAALPRAMVPVGAPSAASARLYGEWRCYIAHRSATAGMFGGKALLRLAAQKSRPHASSVPMRSEPAYFLCKWGV